MKFSMAKFSPKHQAASKLGIAAWTCKLLFLVIGIVSTSTLVARFAFPYFLGLLRSSLPRLRIPIVPFLAPPYLFVAINFIIVAIWKLNGIQLPDDDGSPTSSSSSSSFRDCYSTKSTYAPVPRVGNPPDSNPIPKTQDTIAPHSEGGGGGGADRTLWPPPPPETEPREEEYPDGIDATWKAIIESKSSPTKNPSKKSGIWGKPGQEQTPIAQAVAVDGRRFKKSETFREAATAQGAAAEKEMRRSKTFGDVWVEGDEVFRCKVEEFIKMNYDQRRLQGKESEQRRRLGMVNVS